MRDRTRNGRRRWLGAVAGIALVAAACSGDDDDVASGGESGDAVEDSGGGDIAPLIVAVGTEPDTLDAQAVIDRNSRVFTNNVFEFLLTRDRETNLVPALAESYESVGDDRWRFSLREDVEFHNGEPFDAEAAAFSINRIVDEEYETQRTSYIEGIVGAEVVDEFTVDVLTDGVNSVLPIQITALAMVPPVAAAEADFGENPVGTGPYEFVRWDRGERVVAQRFDGYWGEAPSIDEFHMQIIPDSQTALSALQANEVDLILDLLPEQMDLAPQAVSIPGQEYSYIGFNTYIPELEDPRVRVALNLAIDRDLIADTIYGGEAVPLAAQMQTEEVLGFNAEIEPYEYDPDAARELLAEAGFPDGFDITLSTPIGRYLKVEEAAEVIAAQWAEIGVNAEIELIEFNTFREVGRIPGPEAGALDLKFAWNSNEFFDGSRIVAHITCDGTSSKYCNPEVDQLMADAVATLDQDERQDLYSDVWGILAEDPHAVYLLQQNFIYGLSDRLEWEPRPDDDYVVAEMTLTS